MKAMILAAGYGTRLEPLTHKRPKALMPVANIAMVDRVIEYLKIYGVNEIIINAHHLYGQIVSHFRDQGRFDIPIHIAVEKEILGTGGGIKNVEYFWDEEPFIVINVDILTSVDLSAALEAHKQASALATLVLHDYGRFNQVKIDLEGHILGFVDKPGPGLLAFTGIHIMSKKVLNYIPPGTSYNILDAYRDAIAHGEIVSSFISKGHYWVDMGSPQDYIRANREMLGSQRILAADGAHIDPSSELKGWVIIGHCVQIGPKARLENSIVWDGVSIGQRAIVRDSIVTRDVQAGKILVDKIY